jgi:xylulokinase
LLLGLDVGTTRVKAMLLDGSGAEHGLAVEPTPFVRRPAGVEMDVVDLERALQSVLDALGPARERVAAAGVAGMAESGAPMAGGRSTAPIIAWHDGRGEQTVARLEARFGPALARRTGRQVRSVSSVAKLGWLLEHGVDPASRWLGVPELFLYLFTGAESTEHSLAARTGAYDVAEGDWLPEVAECLGVAPDAFPPVRAAGAVMGHLSEAASVSYGLPAGIPVTLAGHDHLAAANGLAVEETDLLNSVGTAETVLRRHGTVPDVERALGLGLAVTVWPGGEAWGVLGSATRSGIVLGTLAASLGQSMEELDRLAEEAGPGTAASAPGRAAARITLAPGLEIADGPPGVLWAGALRALTARTVATAARTAALLGPHRRLVVFGGGSRSRPWLAAKAEMAGVPVLRSTAAEAAARGAALAAGAAAGWWPAPSAGPAPVLEPVVHFGGHPRAPGASD